MIPGELNRLLAEIDQLFANGKWHAAEQAVNQLIALAPNDRHTWAYRGAIHFHAGQMHEAENCFRQTTELDTHDKASWHHLSMVLHSQPSALFPRDCRPMTTKQGQLSRLKPAPTAHLQPLLTSLTNWQFKPQAARPDSESKFLLPIRLVTNH